jgi:hypothetical protein
MTGHPARAALGDPSRRSSANHPGTNTEPGWPLDTAPLRG